MYRFVDTETWDDPWFADLLPVEKLVFLYLLTNRRSTLCGVFEITIRAMAFETGLDDETIRESLKALRPKVTWYELEKAVFVRNFYRRQNRGRNPKLLIAARKDLAEVNPLIQADVLIEYPELADPDAPAPIPLPSKEIAHPYPIDSPSIPHAYIAIQDKTKQDKTKQDVDETARVRATTPPPIDIETTVEEREIVGIIRKVPGMAAIPDSEIVPHFRDVLSCRDGPALSHGALKADAIKFRDYHTDRRGTATTGKWRGWKNAMTTWFTRTHELPKYELAIKNGQPDAHLTADQRRAEEREEWTRLAEKAGLVTNAGGRVSATAAERPAG